MFFSDSVESYRKNFSTVMGFALLLVFVLPFAWISNSYVSSGTVVIDYGFINQSLVESALLLALALVFLFFYSVLVCLMVFAVRKDMSHVKVHYYLGEKIHKFAFKYFRFLAIFTFVALVVSSLISPYVPGVIINLFLFIASAAFLFLAQTIVVDEESLFSSILSNIDFILKNPGTFVSVMVLGVISVFVLQLVEFAVDYLFFVGNFLSLLVALVVLVPFFEILKTTIYMKRFDIIRNYRE